jgi:hypothetical protein
MHERCIHGFAAPAHRDRVAVQDLAEQRSSRKMAQDTLLFKKERNQEHIVQKTTKVVVNVETFIVIVHLF